MRAGCGQGHAHRAGLADRLKLAHGPAHLAPQVERLVGPGALESEVVASSPIRSGLPDRVLAGVTRSRPPFLGELTERTPWVAGEIERLHPADIVGAGRAIAGFDARPWL